MNKYHAYRWHWISKHAIKYFDFDFVSAERRISLNFVFCSISNIHPPQSYDWQNSANPACPCPIPSCQFHYWFNLQIEITFQQNVSTFTNIIIAVVHCTHDDYCHWIVQFLWTLMTWTYIATATILPIYRLIPPVFNFWESS